MMRGLMAVMLLMLTTMPSSAAAQTTVQSTVQTVNASLAGKIWSPVSDSFVSVKQLVDAMMARPIVLIGERHGRPAHQDREAFLLAALAERKRYPALVLEMLTPATDTRIARFRAVRPEHTGGLSALLQWPTSGWPAWRYYKPVFDMAFAAKLPLLGGDSPAKERDFADAVPPQDAIGRSWQASLHRAHCNLLDAPALAPKIALQRTRDQHMADTLVRTAATHSDGAVLVAGSAHVRRDRGVPAYIKSAKDNVLALALMEAVRGKTARQHLPETLPGAPAPFDFIWFTPRLPVKSPCAQWQQ